ncbi:germination protein [Paenibacillus agaridevorans]|uniref:Germination protein n=1 Tax=Paenibacillus agaridevorans TaxID=171404 RepID=A0A2R5EXU3_9BACL|nr:endospore germination permease [Paenibacillus agaridevorans]GBG11536.1 germination protein [Paenibacillus agaridevorans]
MNDSQSPDSNRSITVFQATAILVSTIIGVGVLPLPLFAANAAGSAAPLVTLLGMLVAMAGLSVITWLGVRFPDQTIIQYSRSVLGKWGAAIGSFVIILFFAILTSLTAREFGEVVVTTVLKTTPVEVTVICMLLLAAAAVRKSIVQFAYMHNFYFPFLLVPCLLIAFLSLKNAELLNLEPIISTHSGKVVLGMLTVGGLFQGSFIITMIIPSMRKPEKAMKASFFGIAIAGGLYLIIVTAAVSVFGSEEIKMLLWPTLELAKATSLPANVLERLDAAFLAVWVTAVFTTLLSSYFLTIYAMKQLFGMKEHRTLSFVMLPFIYFMAMLPQNVKYMYRIIEDVGRYGLLVTVVYPFILLLLALARRKKGAQA